MTARHEARANRRRRCYVDGLLQGRLLWILVSVELAVVALSMYALYAGLSGILEEQLYRAHRSEQGLHELLVPRLAVAVVVLTLANLLILVGLEWSWGRFLHRMLGQFRVLLGRTERLDFRRDQPLGPRHALIERLVAWRQAERRRAESVRALVAGLDPEADFTRAGPRRVAQERLARLRRLLD